MGFLKRNLFYVGTIAVVILFGGGIVAVAYNLNNEIDAEQVKPREAVSSGLGRFSKKGGMVNSRIVGSRKQAVEMTESALARVSRDSIQWNRGDFKPFELPLIDTDTDQEVGKAKAFPIDEKTYNDYTLRVVFRNVSQKAREDLLKSIGAIAPPTEDDISKVSLRIQREIDKRERMRERQELLATEGDAPGTGSSSSSSLRPSERARALQPSGRTRPTRTPRRSRQPSGRTAPMMDPRMDPMMDPMMGDPMMSRMGAGARGRRPTGARRTPRRRAPSGSSATAAGEAVQIGQEAQDRGFRVAAALQAAKGPIYVVSEDLDQVIHHDQPDNATLWEEQVTSWILSDIVGAIKKTIDGHLRAKPQRPAKKLTVPNSPIKHLLSVDVTDGYVNATVGSGATGGGMEGYGRMMDPMGRMRDPMMDPMADPMAPSGARGRGGRGGRGGRSASAQPSGPVAKVANLTGRGTGKRYSVKRYSFSVIMDPQMLPELQKNLLARKNHCVLGVRMAAAPHNPQSPYYYGTGAVMEVTLECELLLLADWERGTFVISDERDSKGQWSQEFPPLMPKEVLQVLKGMDANSLRDEDNSRLGGA